MTRCKGLEYTILASKSNFCFYKTPDECSGEDFNLEFLFLPFQLSTFFSFLFNCQPMELVSPHHAPLYTPTFVSSDSLLVLDTNRTS